MTEPACGVQLKLKVGEDWTQTLTFWSDAVSDPQTFDDPLALNSPVMAVKEVGYSTVLAEFNVGGTGLGAGTTAVSGGDLNILTLTLPYAWTYKFQGVGELQFDIFDVLSGKRRAIIKDGLITVDDAVTAVDGT